MIKYLYHVLTIKDMCYMMEFILWVIFTKIVSKVVIICDYFIDNYWWLLIIIDNYYWWLMIIIDDYYWLLMMIIIDDDYYWGLFVIVIKQILVVAYIRLLGQF